MAETLGNKKDKSAFKAEKRAAIKAARDKAKAAAGKEVKVISAEEKYTEMRLHLWVLLTVSNDLREFTIQ